MVQLRITQYISKSDILNHVNAETDKIFDVGPQIILLEIYCFEVI